MSRVSGDPGGMARVWLNGEVIPGNRARISVFDRGFTLGDGLFETMRAYGGRVFRLRDHLDRLRRSAIRVGLPLPEAPELEAAVDDTLRANGLREAAVRITLSRGAAPPGLDPPEAAAPTLTVFARPAPTPPAAIRAVIAAGRLNEHAPTAGLKRLGYLDSIVALRAARAEGYDDAVFLDTAGHLAEATASNLFLLRDGMLRTPPIACGVLPGITRAAVLELAAELDMPAREAPLDPATLDGAREAFLTSSLREVVPLIRVGDRALGDGEPGPATRRIQRAYRELAGAAP